MRLCRSHAYWLTIVPDFLVGIFCDCSDFHVPAGSAWDKGDGSQPLDWWDARGMPGLCRSVANVYPAVRASRDVWWVRPAWAAEEPGKEAGCPARGRPSCGMRTTAVPVTTTHSLPHTLFSVPGLLTHLLEDVHSTAVPPSTGTLGSQLCTRQPSKRPSRRRSSSVLVACELGGQSCVSSGLRFAVMGWDVFESYDIPDGVYG